MQYGNVILYNLLYERDEIVPTGSLYDTLEYFMEIYEHNKDVKLLINLLPFNKRVPLEHVLSELQEIVFEKYDISNDDFLNNIELFDFRKVFIEHEFEKVLTLDLVSPKFMKQYMIRAKEILIVPELMDSEHTYLSKHNNVEYFAEMPFCHGTPYKMKMAFSKFRKQDQFLGNLYVNYPKGDWTRNDYASEIVNQFDMHMLTKGNKFYKNLHYHFSHYVYFKTLYWHDPHPRLFHECKFYEKPYWYYNESCGMDGSYYRFEDSIEEPLSSRELTKDDEIVQRMI